MAMIASNGLRITPNLSTGSFVERLDFKIFRAVKGRLKRRYARALFDHLNGTVALGPFEGMRLVGRSVWSNDIASMLLGEYEAELRGLFHPGALAKHDVFIDIGSADGYFAVGVAMKSALPVVAFEMSKASRDICGMNADLNKVAAQVTIRGMATADDVCKVLAQYARPLVLIDIEGGELALLDTKVCRALANATIIVESHKVAGMESAEEIAWRLARSHEPQRIQKGPRNPFRHPLVADLAEDFAHLMLSEERAGGANWLVLNPLLASR